MHLMSPTQSNADWDIWIDFAGKQQGLARPPASNSFAEELRQTIVGPAFEQFQELDRTRDWARKRGLAGFELHEAAGFCRPRVHASLVKAQEQVETRKADLLARFGAAAKFHPDTSRDAKRRYAEVRASLPQPQFAGAVPRSAGVGVANPAYLSRLSSLDLEEAEAILAEPAPSDRRLWEAALKVWTLHRQSEEPEKFEAMKAEEVALDWALRVLKGLVQLAKPPLTALAS